MGEWTISFPDSSAAKGEFLANSLQSALADVKSRTTVFRHRSSPEYLCQGELLKIVLDSTAVVAIATGISRWLAKHTGTFIEITRPDGTSVRVKYASGRDTAETVKAALHITE